MKKILFIAPHLSTGGLPQYLAKKVSLLKDDFRVIDVFEYRNLSNEYTVQRKALKELCTVHTPDQGVSVNEWAERLRWLITTVQPDIIHFEELPEMFMGDQEKLLDDIFKRKLGDYILLCSTHTSKVQQIKYLPDMFIWPSPHCLKMYAAYSEMSKVWEYPIEEFTHQPSPQSKPYRILQVGLWCEHKNQKYSIELMNHLVKLKPEVQMVFVGNTAPNFASYWEPLIKDLDEHFQVRGELPQAEINEMYTTYDLLLMPSLEELNPLVPKEALSHGMPVLINPLETLPEWYKHCEGIGFLTGDAKNDAKLVHSVLSLCAFDFERPKLNAEPVHVIYSAVKHLSEPLRRTLEMFISMLTQAIASSPKSDPQRESIVPKFTATYRDGPKLEIAGGKGTYNIRFIDLATNQIVHNDYINENCWTSCARKYFTRWRIEVWQHGKVVFFDELDLRKKKVFITVNSTSIGDTLAWIPYVQQFKQLHDAYVIVSTFHNNLIADCHDLKFVEPKEMQYDFYAHYKVGMFDVDDRWLHPSHPALLPLQRVASDILGLGYKAVRPDIMITGKAASESDKKYVVLCTESTAGCKVWNNKRGWQEVVGHLRGMGYDVWVVQKAETSLKGIVDKTGDIALTTRLKHLRGAAMFIGLSSGLSWMAWACKIPVVMISGFSEPWHEFPCHRIINHEVCTGCINNPKNHFDKGDWHWCPEHKGTEREFECSKSITSAMVIKTLSEVLPSGHVSGE